jgi:nitronate monooxygenase
MSDLLYRIGFHHPIIQAPMAGTSTPTMAAAVSNAGGLGFLGLGSSYAESAAKQIAETKALTSRPFGLNFFCHQPPSPDPEHDRAWIEYLRPEFAKFGAEPPSSLAEIYKSFVADDAMFDLVLQTRPAVVSYHFGLPAADKIAAITKAGIVQMATATSLSEARYIRDAGIDAIVAQGYEAGGHRGVFDPAAKDDRLGMFALVQILVHTMDIPVIAAGGIMDGAGISAALKIGAAAAQLGTAFIGCPESAADSGYRKALASDAAQHTTMTAAVSGRLARCLANKFTAIDDRNHTAYPRAYDAGKALNAAAKAKGEFGYGAQWAGQAAPLARSMPAAELVAMLVREAGR